MIRSYRNSDFADVSWLNSTSYVSPCTDNELLEKLAGKCWVYEDSPIVIGAIIIDKNFVWSLTVARNRQRRGIGTALLNEASKHFSELWLHTEPLGAGARLYTKLGYTASKTEYDFYGPRQDAILMVKRNVAVETTARRALA
jgi:ribosomal protein S18 acetylase RimI-like enzyme